MRQRIAILLSIITLVFPNSASASLNGKEDYSEPRIVAISLSEIIGSGPWANYSGYLYSPRIVFSAGHMKNHDEFSQFYVSHPNQKLKVGMETIKSVKVLFPATYKTKIDSDDFSIIILERPLAEIAKAPLISRELLAQAISAKTSMKVTGFGVYQDICEEQKEKAPCQFKGDRTSLVPRSSEMMPWSASEIKEKYNRYQEEVADHLFMTSAYKGGPCGGDSGGSTTVAINGINYYVGTVPSGFWNAYACGQSDGSVGDTLGYTAPVYKFLDLIAVAEKYVADHPYVASQAAPTPKSSPIGSVSGSEYLYIRKLAITWSAASKPSDGAQKQCAAARDKGFIYKNGKVTSLGDKAPILRRDLKTSQGFKACLAGFKK
jgi:hypothetical protein